MTKVIYNGKLFGIIYRPEDWKPGLDFLSDPQDFIQVGTWWYPEGKQLQAHRHVENPRSSNLTQELVYVVHGRLRIDYYDDGKHLVRSEEIRAGDMAIILEGGHGYEILEDDTKVIEVKNGPFVSVEKDKVKF